MSVAGPVSKPRPKAPKLQTHTSSHSIRAQAVKSSSSSTPTTGKDTQASSSTLPGGAGQNLKGDSKTVYKALLESPSVVRWPTLPSHLQQTLLHTLLDQVIPLAYPLGPTAFRRPSGKKGKTKETRTEEELLNDELEEEEQKKESGLVAGLNACSKLLLPSTTQARTAAAGENGKKRKRVDEDTDDGSPAAAPPTLSLSVLFVCLQDIVPQQLVAHLPAMVAASNARGGSTRVVCLPAGSEAVLAAKLGVRRLGCLGVMSSHPHLLPFTALALLPAPLTASHLAHLPNHSLVPPSPRPSRRVPPAESSSHHPRPAKKSKTTNSSKTVSFVAAPSTSALISTQRVASISAVASSSSDPTLNAAASSSSASFAPLSVKLLKTTTPANPKGRRAERTKGVAEKRKEKKEDRKGKGRGGKKGGVGVDATVVEKSEKKGKGKKKVAMMAEADPTEKKVLASEVGEEMAGGEKTKKRKNRGVKRRRGGKPEGKGAEGEGGAEEMVTQ